MASFDAKKLSQVDWGVAGAGVLALICLFLPWYGVSAGIFSASVSGWSTSYGWLGALLIVAAGAYLVLQRSQVDLSKVPIGPAVVVLGAGGLGTLIVILRWLTLPSGSGGSALGGYSYGPRIGLYLTLLAGLVQVGCAVKLFMASGEPLPWAAKQAGGSGGMPQTGMGGPSTETMYPSQSMPSQGMPFPQGESMPPPDEATPPTV
ncbi:MAG: hypothetical protein ACLQNG_00130 [Acidimicrobiales bacterium]|jgi:hypothetical protein